MPLLAFLAALILALGIIPLVRRGCLRYGAVSLPRVDRWSDKPTAKLGGIGIFLAFCIGLAILLAVETLDIHRFAFEHWGLLLTAGLIFGLGLYDDLRPMTPPAKLISQVVIAALAVFLGYTTEFFSPRVENLLLAQSLNTLLTITWLVAITNAFNLMDNMDGLAGGIAFITAAILGYYFWQDNNLVMLLIVAALAGSVLGFLRYNFPPASIFMGDSGSQFLGFTLALLAIARQPQASDVLAVVAVPTLLFLLPIVDTILVTLTRLLRGESPAKGGRDHTSHRLIAFGLTERQAVLVLYGIALLAGVASILVEAVGYWLSLVVLPFMVILLAVLAAYLGGIKLSLSGEPATGTRKAPTQVVLEYAYRGRLLEVALDFLIIVLVYFLAVLIHKGEILSAAELEHFLHTLPIVLAGTLLLFYLAGVYRGVWRYLGVRDLVLFGAASLGAALATGLVVYLLYPQSFSGVVFILYGILLFLGVAVSRSSFRVLDSISQRNQERAAEERVVIYGADGTGEIAMRWILMHPGMNYRLVGFLDDDPLLAGRQIGGVVVLGGFRHLDNILARHKIDGLILARVLPRAIGDIRSTSDTDVHLVDEAERSAMDQLIQVCARHNCWVKALKLEFEQMS